MNFRLEQGLLVPLMIELTPIETAMVLTHQDAIEGMGFSLCSSNEKELKVDAIPPFTDEGEVKLILSEMANQLQEYIGKEDYQKQREKKLAQIACRFAKTKKVYTKEEGQKLYEQLSSCASPLHSPKGDPTKVRINHDRLKALFTESQEAPSCS